MTNENLYGGDTFLNQDLNKKLLVLTPAYAHWLADVHSGSFAPAFTLSLGDSECSRKPPNAHSLGRYQTCKKKTEDRAFRGFEHDFGQRQLQTNERKNSEKKFQLRHLKMFFNN